MSNKRVHKLALLGILGAWSLVMRFFDFPILPFAPFLKIDFSDLIALLGMLIYGPTGLIAVAGIRDLVNYILKGGEAGIPIGMIMSFVATLAMFLPTHLLLTSTRLRSTFIKNISLSFSLIVCLCLSMALLNYYVALPIYVQVMQFPIADYFAYIMGVILPFNLIKGVILAVGQLFVLKFAKDFLSKRVELYPAYLNSPAYSPHKIAQSH